MNVQMVKVEDLKEYKNNPRFNDNAVEKVAKSIQEFGFKVPIVVDKENVIVAGHTRLKACEQLNIKEVPVIIADDLTDEQVKAFRIVDNKTDEFSTWDFSLLENELKEIENINMEDYGMYPQADYDDIDSFFEDVDEETEIEQETKTCPHCGKEIT